MEELKVGRPYVDRRTDSCLDQEEVTQNVALTGRTDGVPLVGHFCILL